MARIHLFEIEDQTWCPRIIREAVTDFLMGLYKILEIFEPTFKKINDVLDKTQTNVIIDCCSGSSGPLRQLRNYLDNAGKQSVSITLTDKYPNLAVFKKVMDETNQRINAHLHSVDATQFPSELKGLRTFFSSFHHFKPEYAKKILQDAVDNNAPIAIFESTQRNPAEFLRACMTPLMVMLVVPFTKNFSWRRLLFTYVLPIIPFAIMWDHIVSNLRTYSTKELHGLVKQLNAPHYEWEIGKIWSGKAMCFVPYLIGYKAT